MPDSQRKPVEMSLTRWVREDTELGGETLRRGEQIMARLEGQVAFATLLSRMPDLALAGDVLVEESRGRGVEKKTAS